MGCIGLVTKTFFFCNTQYIDSHTDRQRQADNYTIIKSFCNQNWSGRGKREERGVRIENKKGASGIWEGETVCS